MLAAWPTNEFRARMAHAGLGGAMCKSSNRLHYAPRTLLPDQQVMCTQCVTSDAAAGTWKATTQPPHDDVPDTPFCTQPNHSIMGQLQWDVITACTLYHFKV
jgi:hypothetical protein